MKFCSVYCDAAYYARRMDSLERVDMCLTLEKMVETSLPYLCLTTNGSSDRKDERTGGRRSLRHGIKCRRMATTELEREGGNEKRAKALAM